MLTHVIHILFSFPPRSKKSPNKYISRKNNLETQLQIHSSQTYTLNNANRLKTFNIKGKKGCVKNKKIIANYLSWNDL